MEHQPPHLPNPEKETAQAWLAEMPPRSDEAWTYVNQLFHGAVMAMRPYVEKHYPDPTQAAIFLEGATAALELIGNQAEVDRLNWQFATSPDGESGAGGEV